MKKINKKRQLKELENSINFFTPGSTKKIHLLNIGIIVNIISFLLSIFLLDKKGYKNALSLTLKKINLHSNNIPKPFSGFKILFISDLHIDIIPEMKDILLELINKENFDLCCIGGDYKFKNIGTPFIAQDFIKELVSEIKEKTDIISILGNHDQYEFAQFLDSIGVKVLINDKLEIKKESESIFICGIDDASYYGAHDFEEALEGINNTNNPFKILLSHTPDVFKEADSQGFDIFLAGHTHGGQICLPGRIPVITETNAPRKMVYGKWRYNNMIGYTTSGLGCSGIPARFFCPPEVVIIEL
jgi:uncharacterized protein